jgi:hypothetical protein
MANCLYCLDNTLHYTYPVNNGWSFTKNTPIGLQVPESHELFIVPLSCGRNPSVATEYQGSRARLSFYILEEKDVVTGDYEQMLIDIIDELLETLPTRPKALFVIATCLCNLIGIDYDAIGEVVQERYPDIKIGVFNLSNFSLEHKVSAFYTMHQISYGFLDPTDERENAVNFIGNLQAIDRNSEIYTALRDMGIKKAHHISDFESFENYQTMARARLNIVIAPSGIGCAEDMEKKLGIPFVYLPTSYDPVLIAEHYRKLANALNAQPPVWLNDQERMTRQAIADALAIVGKRPLALDYNATREPYNLAHFLLREGFNVATVFSEQPQPEEEADYEALRRDYPHVAFYEPQHPCFVNGRLEMPEGIAIGLKAGGLTETRHIVHLFSDEGLWGYAGTRSLMNLLIEAAETETDYRDACDLIFGR